MIINFKELKKYLNKEKKNYLSGSLKNKLILKFTNEQKTKVWKYVKLLRLTEYYMNKKSNIFFLNYYYKFLFVIFRRLKNKLGIIIGIEIYENCFDYGLNIYHCGNIVVNRNCKIGKNCSLHGSNCIGNDGKSDKCPVIGDNVSIGVGAKIIGDVYIANNIIIGAGAIVTKSFYEEGITIVGVPAKKIK